MNLSKLFGVLLAALALGACAEKKIADPIPDSWAEADCGNAAQAVPDCAKTKPLPQ